MNVMLSACTLLVALALPTRMKAVESTQVQYGDGRSSMLRSAV